MKQVKVYQYERCSTCRKAIKYLEGLGIPYENVAIVTHPPEKAELERALKARDGNLRKLFNTSGKLYREMQLSPKMKTMKPEEGIALLSENGMLVKRPFVLSEKGVLIGFKEAEWDIFFKEELSKSPPTL